MACNKKQGRRRGRDVTSLVRTSYLRLRPPCCCGVVSPRVRKNWHEHTSPLTRLPLTSEEVRAGTTLRGQNPHDGRDNMFLFLSIWLPWSPTKAKWSSFYRAAPVQPHERNTSRDGTTYMACSSPHRIS
jgi:hypothetical protein